LLPRLQQTGENARNNPDLLVERTEKHTSDHHGFQRFFTCHVLRNGMKNLGLPGISGMAND
jgi:hypothetical protein